MKPATLVYQRLKTSNDINGNPRRLYAVYELATESKCFKIVRVIDEGYAGLPEDLRNMTSLPTLSIEPREYKEWRRVAKAQGVLECGR